MFVPLIARPAPGDGIRAARAATGRFRRQNGLNNRYAERRGAPVPMSAFGKAVAALHFRRHTLSADLLWRPLPKGWEMGAAPVSEQAGALAIPGHVLEHRAVLSTQDGAPFSEVVETYTGEVLAFPPPK